jgi:hypothetical protein
VGRRGSGEGGKSGRRSRGEGNRGGEEMERSNEGGRKGKDGRSTEETEILYHSRRIVNDLMIIKLYDNVPFRSPTA